MNGRVILLIQITSLYRTQHYLPSELTFIECGYFAVGSLEDIVKRTCCYLYVIVFLKNLFFCQNDLLHSAHVEQTVTKK